MTSISRSFWGFFAPGFGSIHMQHTNTPAFSVGLMGLIIACQAAAGTSSDWTEMTYSSGWGPCPADHICFVEWHADRATKTVQRTGASGQSSRKLSDRHWSQLEYLVVQAMRAASKCPPQPTDVFDRIALTYEDHSKVSKPVTGCAYAQRTNPVKKLKDGLSK